MSEVAEMYSGMRDHKKRLKEKYGIPCPECQRLSCRYTPLSRSGMSVPLGESPSLPPSWAASRRLEGGEDVNGDIKRLDDPTNDRRYN